MPSKEIKRIRKQYLDLWLGYIGGLQADNFLSDAEKMQIMARCYEPLSTLLCDLEEDEQDEEVD